MDAIVFDGRTLWLAVPDSDRTCSLWFEHDFADCVADQLCDAASDRAAAFRRASSSAAASGFAMTIRGTAISAALNRCC